MEYALEIRDLSKKIGNKTILQDVSFYVMRGESVGMVGKNGAGKTSILKCISGLWINKTGTISVYGKETKRNFRECISRMGVLIEYPSLFLDMTLKQNIEYFGAFCFADYHNEVLRLLELLNLEQSLKPSQQALLERLSAVLTDKDAETMREILKTFALSLQKIRRRKMKIKGKKVLQYMRRYGISVADIADCLKLYPSTLRLILEEDGYLEEEQTERFLNIFGAAAAILFIDFEGSRLCNSVK